MDVCVYERGKEREKERWGWRERQRELDKNNTLKTCKENVT